ncbi:MAG: DUF2891 domain-containing protein [Flavobacteriales bacterium]|nr:DUF2891 domain-containing protein [Flavobacteriales bacterium]
MKLKHIIFSILLTLSYNISAQEHYIKTNDQSPVLTESGAEHFSKMALHCLQTEFPNKLGHVIEDETQVKRPTELHPAFYGCFDWHSSVHGHWMLVKILKKFPNINNAEQIKSTISKTITKENIKAEIAYMNGNLHSSFERTYGWAWLFQLQNELDTWDTELGKELAENLKPLTSIIRDRTIEYLPKLTYPIRVGTHTNTAFALSLMYDYAIESGDIELKEIVMNRSIDYYSSDTKYPAYLEPNGSDFLSPSLIEANLMHKILTPKSFRSWFDNFMPEVPINILEPAIVSDRSDLQIVHLDGLNISRAWCMIGIADNLKENDSRKKQLLQSANDHLSISLKAVESGNYSGEHWLASFAVYALTVK